ncbi:hypothetical protein [Paraburkholderia megapolitana]|nr:hypothetical protein [Paraburkholderia megapolitana]QDQ80752.1 hypothetical protein FNZ07_05970 [Paraburkholderia megapolitana]
MSIANGAMQNTFDAQKVQNNLAVQQAVGRGGMQVVGEVGKHLTDKAAEAVKRASDRPTAAQAELDTANRQYAMWNGHSTSRVGAFGTTAMTSPGSSPDLSAGIGLGTGLTGGFAQNLIPGPVGTSLGYLFQIVPGPMQSAIEKSKNAGSEK